MDRDIEKDLLEIECVIREHEERDNTFTVSVLQRCHELVSELKKNRDLEGQGLLPKLPCKVGDKVYEICEGFIEPCTVEIIFLADYTDKEGKQSYMAEIHYDREDCPYVSTEIYFTDIGKTVFLTQEQAEESLKRMEEQGNDT